MYRRIAVLACVLALTGAFPLALAAEEGPVIPWDGPSRGSGRSPRRTKPGPPLHGGRGLDPLFRQAALLPRERDPRKGHHLQQDLGPPGALSSPRTGFIAWPSRPGPPPTGPWIPRDAYKKALATTRPVFYREMAIEPGEEYSFVENLVRYVHLTRLRLL